MTDVTPITVARSAKVKYPLRRKRRNRATVDEIALYLYAHGIGHKYGIPDLAKHVQTATGMSYVELDRRMRDLRKVNWVIDSNLTDKTLKRGEYCLKKIGDHVWHKNYVWPKGRQSCPAPLRRYILERDKFCQICGIQPGQPYDDQPERIARLTIGRILPGSRGGEYSKENCRAECTRCNLDVRDNYNDGDQQIPEAA